MRYTIAISNQKGGVGKTTTTVNLSACLAMAGKKTLIIDIDPQANATTGLGLETDSEGSVYQALLNQSVDAEIIKPTSVDSLYIVPSDINLIGAEIELISVDEREYRIKNMIASLPDDFDFVIIDCPPSLGILTLNALTAADSVLIPLQTEYYALEGLKLLMQTIEMIKNSTNPDLEVEGVVFTMFDKRTSLANQVVDEVRNHYNHKVFNTVIPRNIRLSEAPSHGLPISMYATKSKGSDAYIDLARELIEKRRDEFTKEKVTSNE